jgi:hypothetical protein
MSAVDDHRPEQGWGDLRSAQYALVYDEARRALERQAASLDGVRGRAGTIIAASSLVTTFIGNNQAVGAVGPAFIVALISYIGVVLLAVVILWPVRGWRLGPETQRVLDDYVDRDDFASLPELHRSLAIHMQSWYSRNQDRLNIRLRLFSVACTLMLIEVVALVIELRGPW